MRHKTQTLSVAMAVLAVTSMFSAAQAGSCFKKGAVGNALTEELAKFQVDAALLQATDWSIYFTYISSGTTPGYSFGKRTYKCTPEAVGWQCRGSATLCKL